MKWSKGLKIEAKLLELDIMVVHNIGISKGSLSCANLHSALLNCPANSDHYSYTFVLCTKGQSDGQLMSKGLLMSSCEPKRQQNSFKDFCPSI
jgi:hypothetical protein